MPERFVLDSFALMALFRNEVSASRVQHLIDSAVNDECELFISAANLGEVMYTIERWQGVQRVADAIQIVNGLPIEIVDIDQGLALAAARLKTQMRMGYLDCFVAALAQRLDAAVVTGDPDFRRLEGLVAIEWLPVDEPQ